jgi:mono/diheme cytochrome c family protein
MSMENKATMIRGFVLGVAATLAIAALAAYLTIRSGIVSAAADERVPKLERWAAKTSLRASFVRNHVADMKNPVTATDANLTAGLKLYAQNCAICHGGARGGRSNIAAGLYQDPPQFHREGVSDDPPGKVFWQIDHGIRWTGMPAFGKALGEKQAWQLTLFVQHIDQLPPAVEGAWRQVRASAAPER